GDTHGPPYDGGHEFAGVNVPAGAVIDFVGLQSCPGVIPTLTATLFYVDRYSGTTSGIVSVAEGSSCGTIYNASPLGWQLMANAHNALVVDVYQPSGNETGFLEWVEIWWKRAVSPPPATPSFTDVPMSDFGYQYIEALKASGITGGCGDGTTFCPDANLTRRQMAIFLAKALGLHWPN
ncbi:MAG TPA: S-layer homology domain-containing protein, partial [Sphingomicrobium sp.]|nr:S-layer homology domain-containing protein [Sphingomicrobium sp.]